MVYSGIWIFYRIIPVFSLVNSSSWKEREREVLHYRPLQHLASKKAHCLQLPKTLLCCIMDSLPSTGEEESLQVLGQVRVQIEFAALGSSKEYSLRKQETLSFLWSSHFFCFLPSQNVVCKVLETLSGDLRDQNYSYNNILKIICLFHYMNTYIDSAKIILGLIASTLVQVNAVEPNCT